jgi:hypothetical protein
MRFITLVKSLEKNLSAPPKALVEAIDQLAQDMAKAGCVMIGTGGLFPTSAGARVRLAGGKITVMDGPFTEAKEVVGGYAIFQVKSKAEMIEWTTRFMELHKEHMPGWDGETEIRQMFDTDVPAEQCGGKVVNA